MEKLNEWRDIEYFDETFDKRTKELIDLLPSENDLKSVLDIGCGMGFAQDYLNVAKGIINYSGLDYKKRNDNTIVCDLNKMEFAKDEYDLFLVAGCLEYVENVEWFFSQFNNCKMEALISYCDIKRNSDMSVRKRNAWKSHLYEEEIIKNMEKQGFFLLKSKEYNKKTILLDFRRK